MAETSNQSAPKEPASKGEEIEEYVHATTPTISLRTDRLVWRVVDKEVVLLDLRASRYFSVNSSGTLLWRLLAKGTTPTRLGKELARSYGVDGARARMDVDRFLGKLNSRGLLESGTLQRTRDNQPTPTAPSPSA
jgi:hypothetical protein